MSDYIFAEDSNKERQMKRKDQTKAYDREFDFSNGSRTSNKCVSFKKEKLTHKKVDLVGGEYGYETVFVKLCDR